MHNFVKSFGVHNYRGARIPLAHNNINVATFRDYLIKFKYPQIHIMQFVEFGFPLGLWSEAYLEPTTRNHSSAYSHYSFVDKFIDFRASLTNNVEALDNLQTTLKEFQTIVFYIKIPPNGRGV